MKRKFTLLLSMLLMLGAGSSWADADLTISNASDWGTFCSNVNNGTNNYSGKTVVLAADISISSSFQNNTVGNSDTNSFQGTFDGAGYTITYDFSSITGLNHIAPFRYIKNATIKNLKTAGTFGANQGTMAGVVAEANGTCTISNCTSSMAISSSASSDANCGGILSVTTASASVTVQNCAFTGTITSPSNASGIVSYFRSGTNTLKNVLFAGTITCTNNSNVRNIYRSAETVTTDKIYYITAATGNGTAATDGTKATSAQLLNGELAKTLVDADGTNNTLFWGQGNLNKSNVEAYPNLTSDNLKAVKAIEINGMGTKPLVNPEGAAPNPCRFGKLGFKASSSDATTLQTMPNTWDYSSGKLETTTGMYCVKLSAAATTLILPFDVTTLPDGITAYDVTYSSGETTVTATKVEKITANKPVLINGTAGTTYKFTGTFGGTFDGTLTDGVKAHTNGALTGVYVDANASSGYNPIAYVPKDSYVLQKQGENLGFYKVNADNTIKITSFRAYLTASAKAPRLSINFEDENATAISSVERNNKEDDAIYTLTGIKVEQPASGIYIKNGKKYYVK